MPPASSSPRVVVTAALRTCRDLLGLVGLRGLGDVDPWHEIVPRLWMGSAVTAPHDGFDLVVTLSARAAAATPAPDGVAEEVVPLVDTPWLPVPRRRVATAVDAVLDVHAAGGSVLVRCRRGVNRSGLVIGEVLARLGHDRAGLVSLIRDRRDPRCLENPRYRAFLAGRLPA